MFSNILNVDLQGDGRDDLAIFRPSTGKWFIRQTLTGQDSIISWGGEADQAAAADYTGNGATEIAVYRPSEGKWYIKGLPTQTFGGPDDIAIPADYDGDGKADLALFRAGKKDGAPNTVFIRNSSTSLVTSFNYGIKGDLPIWGDFDGDGRSDFGIVRPGADKTKPNLVVIERSSAGTQTFFYGLGEDIPVVNDYDGDGVSDFGIYRPSTGLWSIFRSQAGPLSVVWGGFKGDIPAPGKYDNDGFADITVYRKGKWYILKSGPASLAEGSVLLSQPPLNFGGKGDIPVPGFWDGDNTTDIAVYRPSEGKWYINRSTGGSQTIGWGVTGDIPVPGDWDNDGIMDVAIFRPSSGQWFIQRSKGGSNQFDWGGAEFTPLVGDFNKDGFADAVAYRNGIWNIRYSSTLATKRISWGIPGDLPVVGDFDGDGASDIAVFRPSNGTWYVSGSRSGSSTLQFGAPGDQPYTYDFNKNGKSDFVIFRPSTGNWFVYLDTGVMAVNSQFGGSGDRPLMGDFDGDGKGDMAVFRGGQWWIRDSSTFRLRVGNGPITFGSPDDQPVGLLKVNTKSLKDLIGSRASGGGFVWKPHSEGDGKLVVLLPATYRNRVTICWIADQEGKIIEMGRFSGDSHNGGRPHYRFSKHGSGYGNVYLVFQLLDGSILHYPIPNGANRWDY
ncbi:MAG: VCBS repeat-containing protein [Kiritimatiellia bacterium]